MGPNVYSQSQSLVFEKRSSPFKSEGFYLFYQFPQMQHMQFISLLLLHPVRVDATARLYCTSAMIQVTHCFVNWLAHSQIMSEALWSPSVTLSSPVWPDSLPVFKWTDAGERSTQRYRVRSKLLLKTKLPFKNNSGKLETIWFWAVWPAAGACGTHGDTFL